MKRPMASYSLMACLGFVLGSVRSVEATREACGADWDSEEAQAFLDKTFRAVMQQPVDPAYPEETDRVAVLVEPRKHPCIGYVIRSVLHYLEDDWALQVYHGLDNIDYIEEEITRVYDEKGRASLHDDPLELLDRVTFSSLPDIVSQMEQDQPWPQWLGQQFEGWKQRLEDHETRTGEWTIDRHVYSQILLQPGFWEAIPGEHVLIFHTDSWLCKPGLEQYLDYDFIGAPWRMCTYGEDHPFWTNCQGGDGGLSLRRRSAMLRMTRTQRRTMVMEDYQIAQWIGSEKRNPYTTLDLRQAQDVFSRELGTGHGGTPMGIHKIWGYQPESAVRGLLSQCMADLTHGPRTHGDL